MTDYIYRGLSYSAHQPSVGTYVDAQYGWFYAYTNFNSVKFSTSPAVEVTVSTGIRPTLGRFDFDIGAAYYYYPGEIGPDLSNYSEGTDRLPQNREAHAGRDARLWAGRLAIRRLGHLRGRRDLARSADRTASGRRRVDAVRRSRPFGVRPDLECRRRERRRRRASAAGLHQLARRPTISYNVLKLGLNYTDTTLSKEKCYVMTGDLGALAGGVSTADNPTGLRSALCGTTFSATLGFEISPAMRGR